MRRDDKRERNRSRPMRDRFTILIVIGVVMLFVSAATVYGSLNIGSKSNGSSDYFDSLNDFDWSKTCPAAGCRNKTGPAE